MCVHWRSLNRKAGPDCVLVKSAAISSVKREVNDQQRAVETNFFPLGCALETGEGIKTD